MQYLKIKKCLLHNPVTVVSKQAGDRRNSTGYLIVCRGGPSIITAAYFKTFWKPCSHLLPAVSELKTLLFHKPFCGPEIFVLNSFGLRIA